jgi:hypothetical protein
VAGTSNVNAGMFLSSQVWVDSWRANFSFVLGSTGGAHNGGFSFLVQADNIASVGPNNAGLGYGAYTGGAGAGFRRSLALEFDTFFDPQVDDTLANCSTPHFALHSMGAEPNSADEGQANIAKYCYNKVRWV